MEEPRVEDVQADELLIRVEEVPSRLLVRWTGRSNARNPGKLLEGWMERLLATAGARHLVIEMHFEKLELFNSSTIAALIQLINAARERQVVLEIHYDSTLRWQALSFDALKRALKPFESSSSGGHVDFVHTPRG